MWVLNAFGAAFFAGITAILSKIGVKEVDSHLATALRTVVVVLFTWYLVFLTGTLQPLQQIPPRTLVFLGLSGLATGGSWLCYFRALQIGDVNKVVPVDKSSTVLTMVLAALFLGERLTPMKVLAMVLIAVGTYLMIERKEPEKRKKSTVGKGWFFYAALSAVFASLTAILGKVGMQGIDANLGTAIRTVVVLVFAWGMVFATGKHREITKIGKRSWLFLVLSGFATGFSWICYYQALQDGPASVVVPIDKLSILVTVVFAGLVLKERLTKKAGIGLLGMVAGTLLLLLE